MKETLQQAAEQIVSGTAGQIIDKAGYASIGTGLGINAASTATHSYIDAVTSLSITEWAAIFSILGAASLIAKNLFEIWWRVRETKKNGNADK